MKQLLTLILSLLSFSVVSGEPGNTPVDWKLSGRLLMDGGVYIHSPRQFHNGVHISDVRLAAKVHFGSEWSAKIDVGFANNKIALKDAFLEYGKEGNYFRAGYMLGYFSMDESTSTNDFIFHTGSNVTETFYPNRRIGLSYTRSLPSCYFSFGAFCGDGLTFSEDTEPGYNFTGRGVWKPVHEEGSLLHVGTGILFKVPNKDTGTGMRSLRLKSKGVTYLPSPRLLDMTFESVRNQMQTNAECLFFRDKWMVQTEYLLMRVEQAAAAPAFIAQGGYIQGGYLIRGHHYGYDPVDAVPVMPADPHSILLACRYNYTNLNDTSSHLYGGCQHDISVGINYYFNRYISSRLNYAHVWTDRYAAQGKCSLNLMQLRLQVRF